ncbi:RNA recognition motif domain containing protein [Acanthamoeba castellanii str. Neff]|uniref:RNA recognition motif domain containing protein n=1 Tax=Acanthamoeba castellanii (strain ATCC 30010 / Neff) TaxID=1257118 RepID=L8HHQ2_ACACF|nr:RNA recognition motif domain containing protein [Acanthamoeba castellanii str. Neff]ELR24233.1 RNA recognition motif domain containing protein [Acanthamoeba castellanii str. Neff]
MFLLELAAEGEVAPAAGELPTTVPVPGCQVIEEEEEEEEEEAYHDDGIHYDYEGEDMGSADDTDDEDDGGVSVQQGETTLSSPSPLSTAAVAAEANRAEGIAPTTEQTEQARPQQQRRRTESDARPLDRAELGADEKERALAAMLASFNASHALQVTGVGSDITTADLEPVFAEFGKVHGLVVEPSRRDVVVVRMPHDAAQKAKAHFAEHPLRVKDKELQASDATLECFLFVGNLNEDVEPEHLRSLFQAHGEPERTIVMRSTATGRKKGYGFVEMRTKAQAGAAKALLGATNFHGRSLRIDWCRLGKLEELHSPVLFVDKLPPNFTDYNGLRQLFLKHGTVKNINVPVNPMNSIPRGFAFVTLSSAEEAEKARDALHDTEFRGSHIRISFGNPAKADIATGPISPRFNPPAAHRGQPYARGGLYPPPLPYHGRGGRGGYFPPMRNGWGRGDFSFGPAPGFLGLLGGPYSSYRPTGPSYQHSHIPPGGPPSAKRPNLGYQPPQPSYQPPRPAYAPPHRPVYAPPAPHTRPTAYSAPPPSSHPRPSVIAGYGSYGAAPTSSLGAFRGAPAPSRPPYASAGPAITSLTYGYHAQQSQVGGGQKRTHEQMQGSPAAPASHGFPSYPPAQAGFVPYAPPNLRNPPSRRPRY